MGFHALSFGRLILGTLAVLATPALAWEAGVEGTVCTLSHDEPDARVRLTYDPATPEYTITLTRRDEPWVTAPNFSLRFDGPRPIFISTDRHTLKAGNAALSVADRGFGNVLDGLQFNRTAVAVTGDQAIAIPLDGAAPEVAAFRACATAPLA